MIVTASLMQTPHASATANDQVRGDDANQIITMAIKEFKRIFPCERKIKTNWKNVSPGLASSSIRAKMAARSPKAGHIDFYGSPSAWRRDVLLNTATHEMGHACRRAATKLETPIMVEGKKVIAIHGFRMITEHGSNGILEEAMAEAMSMHVLGRQYLPRSIEYYSMALALLKRIKTNKNDIETAQKLHKNNDLSALIGLLLNKSKNNVTAKDIELILNYFRTNVHTSLKAYDKNLSAAKNYQNIWQNIMGSK